MHSGSVVGGYASQAKHQILSRRSVTPEVQWLKEIKAAPSSDMSSSEPSKERFRYVDNAKQKWYIISVAM